MAKVEDVCGKEIMALFIRLRASFEILDEGL